MIYVKNNYFKIEKINQNKNVYYNKSLYCYKIDEIANHHFKENVLYLFSNYYL